jgi:hypothetical protein
MVRAADHVFSAGRLPAELSSSTRSPRTYIREALAELDQTEADMSFTPGTAAHHASRRAVFADRLDDGLDTDSEVRCVYRCLVFATRAPLA